MPYTKEGIGHVNTDTSAASAERVPEFDSSLRGRIVAMIAAAGDHGHTCEEIENALAARHQTVSSAIRRCVLALVLIDSGRRRTNKSGRDAIVWIIREDNVIPLRERLRARRKR